MPFLLKRKCIFGTERLGALGRNRLERNGIRSGTERTGPDVSMSQLQLLQIRNRVVPAADTTTILLRICSCSCDGSGQQQQQLQLQRLWSMADQWWRNGTAAPISKHVVVMTGYRRIGIPGHDVQMGLQAVEIPSFRCVCVSADTPGRYETFFSLVTTCLLRVVTTRSKRSLGIKT